VFARNAFVSGDGAMLVVKTALPSGQLDAALRAPAASLGSQLRIGPARPVDDYLRGHFRQRRFQLDLAIAFALSALGLAAPGKTPASIVAFLNKHLNDAINSASFRRRMEPLGMTIPADNTPEKFAAYMRQEMARQAELAKLSGHSPMEPKR